MTQVAMLEYICKNKMLMKNHEFRKCYCHCTAKVRGHFAETHSIAAEDERHTLRHEIDQPLNAVKDISQRPEDDQTQPFPVLPVIRSGDGAVPSDAVPTLPLSLSGSTHSHAVAMTIGSGLLASSPSSSSLNAA